MGVPRNVAAREKTELEILRPRLDTELAATPGCVEPRSQPPKDGEELAIDLRVFGFGYGSQ